MPIGPDIHVILRLLLQKIWKAPVLLLLMVGIHEVAVEVTSDCITYIPSFTIYGSGIRVILMLLLQQYERLQCWCYWRGVMKYTFQMDSGREVSKLVSSGSKTAVMEVICVLICITMKQQSQASWQSRQQRVCACSEAGLGVAIATVFEVYITEDQRSFNRFCGTKDSIQRIFMKKCFLFTVGSVCRVKWFTSGSKNVANVSLMTTRFKWRRGSG
jgi:hypothetical protein